MDATWPPPQPAPLHRAPVAGLLGWVLPGLGHLYLGERRRGLILLITISLTFWIGVAIGGPAATVNPREQRLWFVAQSLTGGQSLIAYGLGQRALTAANAPNSVVLGHWLTAEVGRHYSGVAGLLNLLIILDAIGRAEAPRPSRRSSAAPVGVSP